MTDVLELGIQVTGNDEAIADLNRVKGAQQQVAQQGATQAAAATQQARRIAQATATQSTSLVGLGRSWGQVGSALGQVGGVLGRVVPQFASLGSVVGSVGGATTALTGAMGPVGIAIAAVTTAATIAIPIIDALSGGMDENATAAENNAESVRDLAQAYAEADRAQQQMAGTAASGDINDALTERTRAVGILRGQIADLMDPIREIQELNVRMGREAGDTQALIEESAHLIGSTDAIEGARRILALQSEIRDIEAERVELQQGLARAQMDEPIEGEVPSIGARGAGMAGDVSMFAHREAAAEEHEANRTTIARRGAAERERLEREAAERANQIVEDQLIYAERSLEREEAAARETVARERFVAMQVIEFRHAVYELDEQHANAAIERARRVAAARIEAHEAAHASALSAVQAEQQAVQEASQITGAAWTSVGGSMQSFLGDTFRYIQEGNDATGQGFLILLDRFLEAASIEYTLKALAEAGNAVAAYARYDVVAGSAHATAAGIYAAAAALTGIGGAAIQTPSAGAAQGGPAQVGAGSGEGGGTTNITIQLYSPNAVFTEAERGNIIANGLREARRQGGPAAGRF